jgi:L,D-transpeptidase YcbB
MTSARFLALVLVGVTARAGAQPGSRPAITGTVTYRERIALPPEATVRVRLVEVGPRGALGRVIAERVAPPLGQPPFAFALPYDRKTLSNSRNYAVDARIQLGDQDWFVPTRTYFVLTSGRGSTADLLLRRPADSTASIPIGSEAGVIESVVREAIHPMLRWPRLAYYDDELLALYEGGGFAPLWLEGARPRKQARDVIDALLAAGTKGLDATDYDARWLDSLARAISGGASVATRDRAMFDVGVTVGFLRHLSDLHIGRVNPQTISVGINIERKKLDLERIVREAIAADRVAAAIASAEPSLVQYRRMVSALAEYRRLATDTSLRTVPADGTVKPGDPFPGAVRLRKRLVALGDLPASQSTATSATYDAALVDGVKHFQTRNALTSDGVLGATTLARLNAPTSLRVRQIELALERLRWLPALDGGPFVVVNVPAFQLFAFDTLTPDGAPAFRMNVIVGRAVRTETPVFEGDMRYVEFRPYWNVTPTIARTELAPRLTRDPAYLDRNDYELVSGSTVVPPTPENIARLRAGSIYARQRPGPTNALGPAKFIFPNDENIYLHGTPQQELFARTRRDFSHGCIRVEDPTLFAEWVLKRQGEWPRQRIVSAMAGERPTRVTLPRTLPVFLFYTTAVANPDGTLGFFDDIYKHDERLERALKGGYPYAP